MPIELSVVPSRTAILSMDLQKGIVSIYVKEQEEFLARANRLLAWARGLGICVIHVQVGFRPGLPEVSSRNLLFNAVRSSPRHQQLFQGPAGVIHPALGPEDGDIVVVKHRVNAFAGTDLEMILRAKDIDTLVLFGISTSGVVLSTLLHASDADFNLFVIKDCCTDQEPDVHACLVDKVFPRCATVLTAGEFLEARK
ncbi:MAG: cysteine hydrolase family protein [Candidatus Acidiferrales bacterium]